MLVMLMEGLRGGRVGWCWRGSDFCRWESQFELAEIVAISLSAVRSVL